MLQIFIFFNKKMFEDYLVTIDEVHRVNKIDHDSMKRMVDIIMRNTRDDRMRMPLLPATRYENDLKICELNREIEILTKMIKEEKSASIFSIIVLLSDDYLKINDEALINIKL